MGKESSVGYMTTRSVSKQHLPEPNSSEIDKNNDSNNNNNNKINNNNNNDKYKIKALMVT